MSRCEREDGSLILPDLTIHGGYLTKQLVRCILPKHLKGTGPIIEGEFTQPELEVMNADGYGIYWLPNAPEPYDRDSMNPITGAHVNAFRYVLVDMDEKDGRYTKQSFLDRLFQGDIPPPNRIVDSGGGIHAYWRVTDLDAMSYLRLCRRLMRTLITDEAVGQIFQLMRLPGTVNTKDDSNPRMCEELYADEDAYTCEQLDASLPSITLSDEQHCKQHFEKTYRLKGDVKVDNRLPLRFSQLLAKSPEVKDIWSGNVDDRSAGDYRLGHIMFADGFTKAEAMSVLVNSAKALSRAPAHQVSYAENIVDKIWTFEIEQDRTELKLSSSVTDILSRGGDNLKGTRFSCWSYLDATEHGFRLGQVIGLVAGSGVGKTAIALNMFMGFVQNNPDCDHFFVALEQPANEIADRWRTMCGTNTRLHGRVQVMSNYNDDGTFRHLSFDEIKDYILKYQEITGRKAGCVVIDHIGALKKKGAKSGENQDLMDICHAMKAFAVQTDTLLVMQSQAPREKAGIGDLELNKDAAYGTVFFESYCDYLITLWQPLKRCYAEKDCPTVTAFKFCKIRHKNQKKDQIREDVCYKLFFDSDNSHLREMTQLEDAGFDFWLKQASNKRKKSMSKVDVIPYESAKVDKETV